MIGGKKRKRVNFHCTWGKISFWKSGGGAKISIIWIIYTPAAPKIPIEIRTILPIDHDIHSIQQGNKIVNISPNTPQHSSRMNCF